MYESVEGKVDMVRGLYSAYTGMLSEQKRLDVVSNNIANAATTGFKKDGVTNQAFKDMFTIKVNDTTSGGNQAIGTMSLGVKIGEVYTNHTQGSFRDTGNTYDLAIEGNGFFSIGVVDANGNESIKYTRDGSFKVNREGYIVDAEGNFLMGDGGYIQVPSEASQVVIDDMGTIYADGEQVNTIPLVEFEDTNYLKKFGNNYYEAVEGAVTLEGTGTIQQGYLEQSNVQAVEEMVNMITITRAYESNQKVINTIDSMLEKTVNTVGKI